MTVEVRRAEEPAEVKAAFAIRYDVFVDEQHVPIDLEIDADDGAPTTVHLLACLDGRPVGTARLVAAAPGALAHLGRLAVRAGYRHLGIGRALVQAVDDVARKRGFDHVQLAAQVPVIDFYRRLGYVAHGPVFNDAGIDHRMMTKALAVAAGSPSWPVVLFDLDGTLIDSGPGITRTLSRVLHARGIEKSPAELAHIVGPPIRHSLPSLGVPAGEVSAAVADYFACYDAEGWRQYSVYPGVADLLAALDDAGATLAVATGKSEHMAVQIMQHAGLDRHVATVAGALRDGSRESKADVIAEALRRLGIPGRTPAEGGTAGVVMVGDRCHDVDGARHWGIATLFAKWGYGPASEAEAAAMVAGDVAEARGVLLAGADEPTAGPVLDVGAAT